MTRGHNQFPDRPHVLDFVQPFDGAQPEISKAEQVMVRSRFNNFIDDLMLQYVDAVEDSNGSDAEWPINELRLIIPASAGKWDVTIEYSNPSELKQQSTPGVHVYKDISLSFMDEHDHTREAYNYVVDEDGALCRENVADFWAEEQLLGVENVSKNYGGPLDLTASEEEAMKRIQAHLDDAEEINENLELEKSMGTNMQPIGLNELDGLIDFLSTPSAYPYVPK